MKNHWLIQKQAKDPNNKRVILDCLHFMDELVDLVKNYPDLVEDMDFKPLYAKYPRVRIGIRRALLVARKKCQESTRKGSNEKLLAN